MNEEDGSSGNVVARYNYGPWGETDIVHDDGSGAANPILFTGREIDGTGQKWNVLIINIGETSHAGKSLFNH